MPDSTGKLDTCILKQLVRAHFCILGISVKTQAKGKE